MRKIILNLAMSLDGYIIDETGSFDWIVGDGDRHLDTDTLYDFEAFINSIDTVVMGRKAYDDCGTDMVKGKKVIVATSQNREDHGDIQFVNGDIVGFVQTLKKEEGKDIWLFGGSGVADHFMKSDVVDEFQIGIIPIILGSGTPLFYPGNPTVKLHLDSYTVQEGLPLLIYSRRENS